MVATMGGPTDRRPAESGPGGLRARLVKAFGPPPEGLTVRRTGASRVRVSWFGPPTRQEMEDKVRAWAEETGVEVELAWRPVWSCGRPHSSPGEAWVEHVASARMVSVGEDAPDGCGCATKVFGFAEQDVASWLGPAAWERWSELVATTWTPGGPTERIVTVESMAAAADEAGLAPPEEVCSPTGRICAGCGGVGWILSDGPDRCGACGGSGVVNTR